MKTVLAVAAALTIGMAAQAFAEGNGPLTREDSPNSFPPSFYDTPQQIQAKIGDNWFAQQFQNLFANQPTQQVIGGSSPLVPTGTQRNG
jgi:hypothetical protein